MLCEAMRALVGSMRAEPVERSHKARPFACYLRAVGSYRSSHSEVLIEAVHAEVRVGNGEAARGMMPLISAQG